MFWILWIYILRFGVDASSTTSMSSSGDTKLCLNSFINPIDISDCNITALDPHHFAGYPKITTLDMSHNREFDFPSDGSPFLFHDYLLHYHCEHCGITAIYPKTFAQLRRLVLLNLRSNWIKRIPNEAFNRNQMRFLILANNQIEMLNELNRLETMQHLLKLDASENQRFDVNSLAINFGNLERVACRRCELKMLDERWFGQVTRLKELILEDNSIHVVPRDCFIKNRRLQNLNLNGNPIGWLSIVSNSLEFLSCKRCNLTELGKDSIKDLPNLKILELQHNFIHSVDSQAFSCNRLLNTVMLDGNHLTSFPLDVLRSSQSLQVLCLDNNFFQPYPALDDLKQLYSVLKLRNNCAAGTNPLYHFERFIPDRLLDGNSLYPSSLPGCNSLVNISSQNVVFIYPMAYTECFVLKHLEMDGNSNFSFHRNYPFLFSKSLEAYSCKRCRISALYEETFSNLPQLKTILLQHNRIKKLSSFDIFNTIPALQHLNLNHNHLLELTVQLLSSHGSFISIDLSHNSKLKFSSRLPFIEQSSTTVFYASHCAINQITQLSFSLLPAVVEINISNNPIIAIDPKAFESNTQLRILHLANTQLQVFPAEVVENLRQLRLLCLYGMERYAFSDSSHAENNAKLRSLITTKKMHCHEGDKFLSMLPDAVTISEIRDFSCSICNGQGSTWLILLIVYVILLFVRFL